MEWCDVLEGTYYGQAPWLKRFTLWVVNDWTEMTKTDVKAASHTE